MANGEVNKRRRHLVCEIIRGNVTPERSKRIATLRPPPSASLFRRFAARIIIPLPEQNLARDRWMVAHLTARMLHAHLTDVRDVA